MARDWVKPLKRETPEHGTQTNPYPTNTDPSEDGLLAAGLTLEDTQNTIERGYTGGVGTTGVFFQVGGQPRLKIDDTGRILALTPNYDTLVAGDQDITSKKYVEGSTGIHGITGAWSAGQTFTEPMVVDANDASSYALKVSNSSNGGNGLLVNMEGISVLSVNSVNGNPGAVVLNGFTNNSVALSLSQWVAGGTPLRVSNKVSGTQHLLTVGLDGNVSVDGTSSNTNPSLSVSQDGTGDILKLLDGTVTAMVLEDGGNLGIGNNSPSHLVHIGTYNKSNVLALSAGYDLSSHIQWKLVGEAGTTGTNRNLTLTHTASLGNEFIIANKASGGESLRINDSGKIGMGITTPGAWLHIRENNNNTDVNAIRITNAGGGLNDGVSLLFEVASNSGKGAELLAKRRSGSGVDLKFKTSPLIGTNPVETMVLTKDGELGVGLTGPSELIESASNIKAKQLYTKTQVLADAATIQWDANSGSVAKVTIESSRTIAIPTNLKDGGRYTLIVVQGTSGGSNLTWNSAYKWPGGTAPTITSATGSIDVFEWVSNGGSLYSLGQDVK